MLVCSCLNNNTMTKINTTGFRIETKVQYEQAVKRVEDLLPLVTDETPIDDTNRIELELLSNLVADYSEKHFALGEPSFADVLNFRMSEMKLTKEAMAELIGISTTRLDDYISGKCKPTLKVVHEIFQKLNIDTNIISRV